ncbi:MAG TPA: hypothetical protein VIV65_03360, partial [Gemmatimonadaceae bacterium]
IASLENVSWLSASRRLRLRVVGGVAPNAPLHRSIFASSQDPWESFDNDFFRPRGAAFKQRNFTLIPLGGAQLRGFTPSLAFSRIVAANIEADQRLVTWDGDFGSLALSVGPFADAGAGAASATSGLGLADPFMVDAGVGLTLRGRFYDRDLDVRLDAPLVVNSPLTPSSANGLPNGIRWTVRW